MRLTSAISSQFGLLSHSSENPPEIDIEPMWTTVFSEVPFEDHWNLAATPILSASPSGGSAYPTGTENSNSPESICSVCTRNDPIANLILLDSLERPEKPPETLPLTIRWGSFKSTLDPEIQPSSTRTLKSTISALPQTRSPEPIST